MTEDYEQDYDNSCPRCGHSPTHYRDCSGLYCDDGWIDESEDDAINFMPGESYEMCTECYGRGVEEWCPSCGLDIGRHKFNTKELSK